MKILMLFLSLFSCACFADSYDVRTKERTYQYNRDENQLIIGESQEVTVTDKNGNKSTFSRGVGKMIPLDELPANHGDMPVYHRGKRIN